MDMDEYITLNYTKLRNKVKAVTKNHQNSDDLFNDLLLTLLDKPAEYKQDLIEKNKVEHWLMASAKLQFASKTSPFFYQYKKFNMETSEVYENTAVVDEEREDMSKQVIDFITSQLDLYYTVYEKTLTTEHLIHNKSYSEIGREYNINRRYVSETITPVKEELFKKIKEIWNI